MFFGETILGELFTRIQQLDETTVFIEASDGEVTEKVAELNRSQLLRGINAKGILLADIGGEYSDLTLTLHPEKSRFTVTLFDTGEFHESITVTATSNGYEIESDPFKTDNLFTTDLTERWGDEITGLTDESIGLLSNLLVEKYVEYLLATVL